MWWWTMAEWARACEERPVHIEIPAAEVNALAILGWMGNVSIVPTDGDAVVVDGTACEKVSISARARDGRLTLRARVHPQAALVTRVGLPSTVDYVTFAEHSGPITSEGSDVNLAVVSSEGSINIRNGGSLRIAYSAGDVVVDGLDRGLVVDRLVGTVTARGVGGDAVVERVTGDVRVDDMGGDVSVSGGDGEVFHSDVRGTMTVR